VTSYALPANHLTFDDEVSYLSKRAWMIGLENHQCPSTKMSAGDTNCDKKNRLSVQNE
jgi:hypothetical protein